MSRVPQVTTHPPPAAEPIDPGPLPGYRQADPVVQRNILLTLGGAVPFRGGQRYAQFVRWLPASLFVISLAPLTLLLMQMIPRNEWPDSLPLVVIMAATALAHSTILIVRFAQGFLDFGKEADLGTSLAADAPGTPPPRSGRGRDGGERFRVSLPAIGVADHGRSNPGQQAPPSEEERRRTIRWSRYEHAAHVIYLVGGLALLGLEAVHHM